MRWIPSLMRVTFQLIRKPMKRPLSLRIELKYFFFAVFAVFAVQNTKLNQRHLSAFLRLSLRFFSQTGQVVTV
jgi:hypothetical protein